MRGPLDQNPQRTPTEPFTLGLLRRTQVRTQRFCGIDRFNVNGNQSLQDFESLLINLLDFTHVFSAQTMHFSPNARKCISSLISSVVLHIRDTSKDVITRGVAFCPPDLNITIMFIDGLPKLVPKILIPGPRHKDLFGSPPLIDLQMISDKLNTSSGNVNGNNGGPQLSPRDRLQVRLQGPIDTTKEIGDLK